MCGAEKQSQRVHTHEGVVRRWKSQWTTDFSRNSGTYIVCNSHETCSNSSFSLTMVTSTSHFFAFHWLCCLLPIGYLPKPGSVGVHICHYHWIQPRPQAKVIFWYLRTDAPVFNIHRIHSTCGYGDISTITLLILSLSAYSCLNILWYTAPVDMMTFRWSCRSYQSICQQHPPYSHLRVTLIYYTLLFTYCKGKKNPDEPMPFLRTLTWCETQTASSRIWTRITDSISYNLTIMWNTLRMNWPHLCWYLSQLVNIWSNGQSILG